MMKYTQVPATTFEQLQLNAGILVSDFDPKTGEIKGDLLGATTGGIQFASNATYEDFGEDIDNIPNGTKELKRLQSFDPTMSGTMLTVTPAVAKQLCGAADIDSTDSIHIVPRSELKGEDFSDLWWIGDYSDVNSGTNAGFMAIHLMNALNQSGFQIQSTKQGKGNMAFEYHAHYSIDSIEKVPFEIYIKAGSETA